jgi:DNA-binding CsgD family transcriptional regulator
MRKNASSESPFKALSDRERQVIGLAAAGFVDKQIGLELDVSVNTLRTYWSRIREKVGDGPRPALVAAYITDELTSSLPDPLNPLHGEGWVMDADTRTLLATDSINDDHGLSRGIPHPALDYARMTHPEDVDRVRESIFAVADGKLDSVHLVFRMVTPRGVELVNSSVHAIRDGQGRVKKVYGFRVRSLDCRPGHDSDVQIGHWERDYPQPVLRIDSGLAEIIGRPDVRSLEIEEVEALLFPGELATALEVIDRAVRDGVDRIDGDLRFIRPNGEVVWSRITRRISRAKGGTIKIHGTLVVFR